MIQNNFGNFSALDISANDKPKVEQPTPGAYVAIIKNAYVTKNWEGEDCVQVDLDIAEGSYAGFCIRKMEANGSVYFPISKKIVIPQNQEDMDNAKKMKKLWKAVADSNADFIWNENAPAFDEHQLIGKRVGIMLGDMWQLGKKEDRMFVYKKLFIKFFMAISKVATAPEGDETLPLKAEDQAEWDAYQARMNNAAPQSTGLTPITPANQGNLPF